MTPLLQNAQAKGCKIVTGIGMLLQQARPGFQVWFGQMPSITNELREKVLAA
jgi:shikimate dehydrogenase